MLIAWICRSVANQGELPRANTPGKCAERRPPGWQPQASSLQSLSNWKRKLTTIVLEMEQFGTGDLAGKAGDDTNAERG
jgi:hypothetical protein